MKGNHAGWIDVAAVRELYIRDADASKGVIPAVPLP